jgi:polyisoprenoid-binding protein YceI
MTPQNGTVHYAIDSRASQFTVQAFASGLISAVAHSPKIAIRDWTGGVDFVPETVQDAKLRVVVKAASLEVLDELRDSDRRQLHRVMNQEVLETERFPEVTFESSNIAVDKLKETLHRVNVTGQLALHGVNNNHAFFAFRAYGEFTLLQSDYGIAVASIAGGTLKLQDELKFTFYAVGRKRS